jgi:hypothetical protein
VPGPAFLKQSVQEETAFPDLWCWTNPWVTVPTTATQLLV